MKAYRVVRRFAPKPHTHTASPSVGHHAQNSGNNSTKSTTDFLKDWLKPSALLSIFGMVYLYSSKDDGPWKKADKIVLTVESLNRRFDAYYKVIAAATKTVPTKKTLNSIHYEVWIVA